MYPISLGLLLLGTAVVNAFQDTSPLFFFSTSEVLISSPQIVSEASISKAITLQLQKCPSDVYIIISQPSVNALDFQDPFSAPHLRQRLSGDDTNIRSSLIVSEVVGRFDAANITRTLQDRCGARLLEIDGSTGSYELPKEAKTLVINIDFPSLPSTNFRAAKLIEHDSFLSSLLNLLPSSKYTVLYTTTTTTTTTTPPIPNIPESENFKIDTTFQFPTHMELKRDFTSHKRASTPGNSNNNNTSAPLFERYQFFGPGIFMGLIVSILLLSILYVAIRGLSSLQVSYAAFDKEMGPAAQKKHAQ